MLDRLRALMPFEQKETKPEIVSLSEQMIRKAMELSLVGGFKFQYISHLTGSPQIPYVHEWFAVMSSTSDHKFTARIKKWETLQINEYECTVKERNDDGSYTWLIANVHYLLGTESFEAFKVTNTGRVDLDGQESAAVLNYFLASTLEAEETERDFLHVLKHSRREIEIGEVKMERVRDMQNSQELLAGF